MTTNDNNANQVRQTEQQKGQLVQMTGCLQCDKILLETLETFANIIFYRDI
jgi:hypothetical protein